MEEPKEKGEKRNPDGTFAPGHSGGPGRPQGSISIIGRIKAIFEEDPTRFEEYVKDALDDPKLRAEIIRQIDGAPKQKVDITTKGESLNNPVKELTDAELAALAYEGETGTSEEGVS